MPGLRHWWQASRPLAQINIGVPLLVGQIGAWYETDRFDWRWFGAAMLWGLLDHLLVVYANDYADRDSDTTARTRLSGGSGVIVEGKLSARQIRSAAALACVGLIGWSAVLACAGRPWAIPYAAIAAGLVWAYSYQPLRLGYRGGGEVLQGLGVGIGLPSLGYYLQSDVAIGPLWMLAPAFVLGASSNILTALPDIDADRAADKKTLPVRLGVHSACAIALTGIAIAALAAAAGTPGLDMAARSWIMGLPLAVIGVTLYRRAALATAWWGSIALNLVWVTWLAAMWGSSPWG